jgi:divalent metal cation (Fe/Co/Zn/Cd) transporter
VVRTRQIGKVVHVDLEVCLDGQTPIARCDEVAAEIKRTLSRKMNQPEHAINVSYCTD